MSTPDVLDEASEHEQEMRDDAVSAIRRELAEAQEQTFEACQWCGDPSSGDRYCSIGCKEDSARHAKMTSAAYRRGQ